jgi:HlyD family secretion protein
VNIGQTVVSSLNAPSLFLIARDLSRMEVWVAVNEADVAKIHPGQAVSFTVDALPEETFCGEVVKVRPNASMTQNVVTYTVDIATGNSSGRLLPYLSANVRFEVARREKVLLVPSAALRFSPSVAQVDPEYRGGASKDGEPANHGAGSGAPGAADEHYGVVYAAAGRYVRPIIVKVGLSNGSLTEVTGEGIAEGTEVVTGVETAVPAGSTGLNNPFTPKLPSPPRGMGPR